MIASLKSERLKAPNEGSKPEFHLRWIRELVTRISSPLDFLTTSRLIDTNPLGANLDYFGLPTIRELAV
jgi:hypothetical protein